MFKKLSDKVITVYGPGSDTSNIHIVSYSDFVGLSDREVAEIYARKSILVRGCDVDPRWEWGLPAFSVMRPIHGTVLRVQG